MSNSRAWLMRADGSNAQGAGADGSANGPLFPALGTGTEVAIRVTIGGQSPVTAAAHFGLPGAWDCRTHAPRDWRIDEVPSATLGV